MTASERLSRLIGDAALGVLDRVLLVAAGVITGVEVTISLKPEDVGGSAAGGLGIPGGTQVAANGFKVGISAAAGAFNVDAATRRSKRFESC